MPDASHKKARTAIEEARKSAHTADQVIAFSDDAAQSAVHNLANAVRQLAVAVGALLPRGAKGARS